MKKKQSSGLNLKPILVVISILLIPLIVYIFYRISVSSNRLIPISVLALISGAIIEKKRLTTKWSTVLYIALFSFVLSFMCFFPGKNEMEYIVENHIAVWPYWFLMIFVIITYAYNKDKIIPRMTEGVTLIMSIGLIYWMIDYGFYDPNSAFVMAIMIVALIIATFSIINAFINVRLSKSLRLFLSIWSSIIMILLAIDNVNLVYKNGQVEDSGFLIDKINVGLQYFLLGICSIYILQNLMMIIGFLPDKYRFFNKEYFSDVRELKYEHINRYSENQSNFSISFICLILSAAFFIINYSFNLLPRNSAIWLTFFTLNNVVYFYDKKKDKTTANETGCRNAGDLRTPALK